MEIEVPRPGLAGPSRALSVAYPWPRLAVAAAAVAVIGVVAAGLGAVNIPPGTVASIVADHIPWIETERAWPESWETIVWELRLPRVVLAGIVGAALAASGATYQGLFRNPLADPYLIGVAAGAGLGATVVLVSGGPVSYWGISILPIAAFAGAIGAVAIAYAIARRSGGIPLTTLVLAGVAVASIAGAMTSLLMIRANPDVRPLLGWLLGGFVGARWLTAGTILPYLAVGIAGMFLYSRILNVLQLGEEEAAQVGVDVERTKLVLVVLATLSTAAAVSVSGLIGFVGLVAPHAARLLWGHDHRTLLPMAMAMGAGFLILADLAARTVARPSELPVGVVTAFCGAPFFIYLLVRLGRHAR
ncbi:MAG: iron ABC transporter permease [Chloroflexi bacterium]|nr:iron ABC transporter permease [Chloroflexota bacterium]